MAGNVTNQLLDELAVFISDGDPASDYQISKYLGVTRQRVSQWRRGVNQFGSSRALQICELLYPQDERKTLSLICRLKSESEKDDRVKTVWEKMANRVAMLAMPLFLCAGLLGSPNAAEASAHNFQWQKYTLCEIWGAAPRLAAGPHAAHR